MDTHASPAVDVGDVHQSVVVLQALVRVQHLDLQSKTTVRDSRCQQAQVGTGGRAQARAVCKVRLVYAVVYLWLVMATTFCISRGLVSCCTYLILRLELKLESDELLEQADCERGRT